MCPIFWTVFMHLNECIKYTYTPLGYTHRIAPPNRGICKNLKPPAALHTSRTTDRQQQQPNTVGTDRARYVGTVSRYRLHGQHTPPIGSYITCC